MKRTRWGAIALAGLMAIGLGAPALAQDEALEFGALAAPIVCPESGDGWQKIDNLNDGQTTKFDLVYDGWQGEPPVEGTVAGTGQPNTPDIGYVTLVLDAGWTADLCIKGGSDLLVNETEVGSGEYGPVQNSGNDGPSDVSHFSYGCTRRPSPTART
jgi:hypothetical protein